MDDDGEKDKEEEKEEEEEEEECKNGGVFAVSDRASKAHVMSFT